MAQIVMGCSWAAQGVIFLLRRDTLIGVLLLAFGGTAVVVGGLLARRRSVADATGVRHAPIRKQVAWSQVDHVAEPTRWDGETVLVLRDGTRFATGFPTSAAAELAELGGVHLGESVPRP